MVSDQEIASCVESLLRQAGPAAASTATVAGVVHQLEAKLGLDLSQKTAFIRDQIDHLLGPHRPPPPPQAAAGPSAKDHFALSHHQQIQFQAQQPLSQHHHQAAVHQLSFSPAASSPFTHLPHHHELSFRYPAPVPAATAPEAVALEQQQFRQLQFQFQQHQQHPPQQQASQVSAPVAVRPAAASATKESAPKRRGGPGGLSKVCGVSPELQAIVGEPTMARTQIVKHLWAYIRKNNLQDPNNKRKIICNDELRQVFETDSTDMFKMNKLLAKHIVSLDAKKESGSNTKKQKTTAFGEVDCTTETDPDQIPVIMSDALASFLGTEEKEMLQPEVLRRVWDYIKSNQLEDSVNGMVILCDSKLQELLGCESISALGVPQMLSRHLFKKS